MTSPGPSNPRFDPNLTYPINTPFGIREMDGAAAHRYAMRQLAGRPRSLEAFYGQLEEVFTVATASTEMVKTFEDAMAEGTGWMKAGQRIDPKGVLQQPSPAPIDYKTLLIKYMQFLTRTHGTTWLFNSAKVAFTEGEFAELRRILWEDT